MRTNIYSKIGAMAYLVWGLLHIKVAIDVYHLGVGLDAGLIQARLFQNAWHLAVFAVLGSVLAVIYNWRNSSTGFWLNLAIISLVDLGYVWLVLLPGYIPLFPGVVGPVFWLIGAFFTGMALLNTPEPKLKN